MRGGKEGSGEEKRRGQDTSGNTVALCRDAKEGEEEKEKEIDMRGKQTEERARKREMVVEH